MKPWHFKGRLVALMTAVILLLAGCNLDKPSPINPAGPVAQEQFKLIILSISIMLVVCLVVFVLFFTVLIRFREKPGDENVIPKQVEGNHKLEIVWTVVPLFLLLALAIPTVALTFELGEDHSETEGAINVQVVAHQYWWEFNYKDLGIYTAQELIAPENARVQFQLDAADVIHSFWIPAIGGKTDTNPHQSNYMYLDMPPLEENPEHNIYLGKCAELCGQSHALMDFKLIVVSQDEFDAWVEEMREPVEVSEAAKQGEELFSTNCLSCHAISGEQASPSGPNLKGYANRDFVAGFRPNTEEWVKEWIRGPSDMKPGALMPSFDFLSDDEIDSLVQYLFELK